MQNRSIKKNLIFNTILTVGEMIFPLITFPYISRVLSPDGLGIVNYANSIISYLILISCLGVNTYGIKEGAKYRDDKEKLGKFVSEMLLINFIAVIFAVTILLIILFFPGNEKYRQLLIIYGFSVFITPFTISWFISLIEEYRYVTIRTIIIRVISMLSIFVFIKSKDDYVKYALILVLTNAFTMILNLHFSKRYISLFNVSKYEIKKHILPILFIFGSSLSVNVYVNSDITLLGMLKSEYSVGIYSVSVKIVRIIITFVSSLNTVIFPRISYYLKNDFLKEYNQLLKKGADFLLLLAVPASVGLLFVSEAIIMLFIGNQYIDAIVNLKILSIDIVFFPLSNYISYQIVLSHNKEKVFLISTLVSCIINIILNIVLIPIFAENAAATTTLISELINIMICVITTRRDIEYREIFSNAKNYLSGTILMGIILLSVKFLVRNIYVSLCISVAVGAFVYFIYLYLRKDSMLFYLIDILKSKISRKKE